MAITNHERIGKALELLNAALVPFIEREMKITHGDKWADVVKMHVSNDGAPKKKAAVHWDTQNILSVMWGQWNDVFRRTLGNSERSLVSELRETRNRWAHQEVFSYDDVYRALDSVSRLMSAVSADCAAVDEMKQEVLRVKFAEQTRSATRKAPVVGLEGAPNANLKPWREVVTPHPDVASGKYQQAEFAADLWQVYLGEGSSEYKHPTEFFRRTFLTDGLRSLLKGAVLRLGGHGGDPVVELQTNFGGGKTHSMLALWHLFSGTPAVELPGVDVLLSETGQDIPKGVRRAVLVGTRIAPGQPHKKPDGTVIRTLWGEIAWQLGGKEGYKLVKEADETATSPGDALRLVFNKYSPCLILIDEWVAYARQLHDDNTLPAGTFDTQFTFAQTLSEMAKNAKNTMLVVSIPSSDNEIGGEWGRRALEKLKNAIGRIESPWRPASSEEGFEIVRRRLFQPIVEKSGFIARDAVARAFSDMYGTQHQEFPPECREGDYERRIKAAYPIHPELFDRLFNDWSALDKFQRTRGVLRLMAAVIHSLWERQDASVLIMPASIPIDDPRVQPELTRYLDDQWAPVIEKDVDGPHSLPLSLDRQTPNLGRYSASRRVARTIYVGSAPTMRAANKGIDDRQVKLGCVQPGESVATFGDALRRLTDRATYLYVDGKRYWYSTQPTVTRLADDRASHLADHDVAEEIHRRLREDARSRGDFCKVHACAAASDVPDELDARLVVLSTDHPHIAKDANSLAMQEANGILKLRGNSPRNYCNMLVFVAADGNRLSDLQQAVRQYMAWRSIVDESEQLNLDAFQERQAKSKLKTADETVHARIPEAYCWLINPTQDDPKGGIGLAETRLQGQDPLAVKASRKLKSSGHLMSQMAGTILRMQLDRIPLWRGDHVSVRQLMEDFARYVYLPRLRNPDVLVAAIREGVEQLTWKAETFAYADAWNEQRQSYVGLIAGRSVRISDDGSGLVVKSEIAQRQLDTQQRTEGGPDISLSGAGGGTTAGGIGTAEKPEPAEQIAVKLTRFHGSVKLNPLRLGTDAGTISQEVLQHLNALANTEVEVTLEVQVRIPDGAPEKVVRDVTENCRTLKFHSYGFEQE